ncbi:MAG: OmpA family protein [Halocynthiibacter sp.]
MKIRVKQTILSAALLFAGATAAQAAEDYTPTIWIDPDGCQHWVMDSGAQGFMTPRVSRDGIPVCERTPSCGVIDSDQLFKSGSAHIGAAGRRRLEQFFRSAGASSYAIVGHTDSRASDQYNNRLSKRRANAVAKIARQAGARVSSVRGMGEREPRATNRTAAGMRQNRRVEIMCAR